MDEDLLIDMTDDLMGDTATSERDQGMADQEGAYQREQLEADLLRLLPSQYELPHPELPPYLEELAEVGFGERSHTSSMPTPEEPTPSSSDDLSFQNQSFVPRTSAEEWPPPPYHHLSSARTSRSTTVSAPFRTQGCSRHGRAATASQLANPTTLTCWTKR